MTPPATERCSHCRADRPVREFVPGLTHDFPEPWCGPCRARGVIELSRMLYSGAGRGVVGVLREATTLTRDAHGVVVEKGWLFEYYGLGAWLDVLERDAADYPREERRAFVLAHLMDCVTPDAGLRGGGQWRDAWIKKPPTQEKHT